MRTLRDPLILALIPLGLLLAGALPLLWPFEDTPHPSERTPVDLERILEDVIRDFRGEWSKPPP
jgi:hypothetical protein